MYGIENFRYKRTKGIKKLHFLLDKFGKDCIVLVDLSYKILSKVKIIDIERSEMSIISHKKHLAAGYCGVSWSV